MVDPATSLLIHDLATPLALLGGFVAHALAWFKLANKKAARDEAEAEHISTWKFDHQKEADARDQQLNKLLVLITEVTASNKGQEIRIRMLEDEVRDNRNRERTNQRGRTA